MFFHVLEISFQVVLQCKRYFQFYNFYYINDFQKRKYNQKNYIMKVFKMLEGVEYSNKIFTFSVENDVEDERIYNQTKIY